EYRAITSERAQIEELVMTYREYTASKKQLSEAQEILKKESDEELRAMAKEELVLLEKKIPEIEQRLKILLLPKDPLDEKNVIVEIRAGTGGDEASIFVADVYRMYQNYFRTLGFRSEAISVSEGDQGYKEIIFSVTGDKVYSKLKFESGVHRVQRVPKTEAQGRIHTSTITVAVMPEPEEVEFVLNMNEVKIEVFRASGAGGQSVNTTDSAVRVTHLPTGTVVVNMDQKSQIKNKAKALQILRTRIYDSMVREKDAAEAATRRSLIGTGDRSERIRTYNYPQGRLTDHRIGFTLYTLDRVMEGELTQITDALMAHYQAEILQGQEE
ncbi:MAG: peptide chain release factor 1, partial [Bdellovibrionota bacterium]